MGISAQELAVAKSAAHPLLERPARCVCAMWLADSFEERKRRRKRKERREGSEQGRHRRQLSDPTQTEAATYQRLLVAMTDWGERWAAKQRGSLCADLAVVVGCLPSIKMLTRNIESSSVSVIGRSSKLDVCAMTWTFGSLLLALAEARP